MSECRTETLLTDFRDSGALEGRPGGSGFEAERGKCSSDPRFGGAVALSGMRYGVSDLRSSGIAAVAASGHLPVADHSQCRCSSQQLPGSRFTALFEALAIDWLRDPGWPSGRGLRRSPMATCTARFGVVHAAIAIVRTLAQVVNMRHRNPRQPLVLGLLLEKLALRNPLGCRTRPGLVRFITRASSPRRPA